MLRVRTDLFVQQAQCILDVGVLQGDGRLPLGKEQSEEEVDDAVEAASDELRVQTQLGKPSISLDGRCPTPAYCRNVSHPFVRVCVCVIYNRRSESLVPVG